MLVLKIFRQNKMNKSMIVSILFRECSFFCKVRVCVGGGSAGGIMFRRKHANKDGFKEGGWPEKCKGDSLKIIAIKCCKDKNSAKIIYQNA